MRNLYRYVTVPESLRKVFKFLPETVSVPQVGLLHSLTPKGV
jgi:hypothetical protein